MASSTLYLRGPVRSSLMMTTGQEKCKVLPMVPSEHS
jgi:hypothetical protein